MIAPLTTTLDELRVAQTARVSELTGHPAVRQRLGEMGLTVGSEIRVVRVAPLGDPMQIAVRNYHLSLRRSESRCVTVAPL